METKYLIWSYEHNAWWKPHYCGYTTDRREAGRYSYFAAKEIVRNANAYIGDGFVKEAMVLDEETLMEER